MIKTERTEAPVLEPPEQARSRPDAREQPGLARLQGTLGNRALRRWIADRDPRMSATGDREGRPDVGPSPNEGLVEPPRRFLSAGRSVEQGAEAPAARGSLRVSESTDPLEHEADRVAERIVGAAPGAPSGDRSATAGSQPAAHQGSDGAVPGSIQRALASPGVPLDPGLKGEMEGRFGHDFSRVRVHGGSVAEASALAIGANAYTVGSEMVFAPGQLSPGTSEGRRLVAHELAHVLQQKGASPLPAHRAQGAAPAVRTNRGPLGISRDDKSKAGKARFKINAGDVEYLQTQVRTLMEGLDPKTRGRILARDTVAVGLVVDPDGDPTLVYTVAGNRTYPELRKQANKQGIVRWQAEPRAKGRGKIGAPGDAEQIMFEAADANGFRVAGMAVTRSVCADCKEAVKAQRKGGVPVVHVEFAQPKGPASGPRAPTRRGKTRPGGAKSGKKKGRKKAPASPKPSKGGGPKAPGAAPKPRTGGKAGAAPKSAAAPKAPPKGAAKGTPKGAPLGGTVGKGGAQRAATRSGGGGRGGAAVGAAIAVAIIDVVGGYIARAMVQEILDEKNSEAIDRDLKALEPRIETLAAKLEPKLKELAAAGGPAFVTVKLKVRWQTDTTGQLGGGTAYMGMDVVELRAEATKLDKVKHESVQEGIGDLIRQQMGGTAEYWTFSLSYPELEVVSVAEPPPEPPPCFIATACCGTPFAPDVVTLRLFRDRVLVKTLPGRAFIRAYYASSPPVARWLARHAASRRLVRELVVAPLATLVRRGGLADRARASTERSAR